MSLSVEKVVNDIKTILDNNIASCSERVKNKVSIDPLPGQIFACFELFTSQNYGMNYNLSFVKDGAVDTVFNEFTDSGESFIPDLEAYMLTANADIRWGDSEDMEFAEQHEQLIQEWFAKVWEQAGGKASKVPTFFAFEKEYMVRDIFTHEIMEETEAATRLGHPGLRPY